MAGKYAPLEKHLREPPADQQEVTLGFEQIEGILKDKLPPSAYEYRQWWEHEKEGNHVNRRAWANAGWKVERVDFRELTVKLVRVGTPIPAFAEHARRAPPEGGRGMRSRVGSQSLTMT